MNTIERSIRLAAAVAVASLLTLTPARAAIAKRAPTAGVSTASQVARLSQLSELPQTPTVSSVVNCDANSVTAAQQQCAAAATQSAMSSKGPIDWDAVTAAVAACYVGAVIDGVMCGTEAMASSVWSSIMSIL